MTTAARSVLEVRSAKDSLIPPTAFVPFLASLKNTLKHGTTWERLFKEQDTITFELSCLDQTIYFIVTCPERLEALIRGQIAAQYSDAIITPKEDYLPAWLNHGSQSITQVSLTSPYYLPINTIKDNAIDPLASVLGVLSKTPPHQAAIIQIVLSGSPSGWHKVARSLIQPAAGGADAAKPAAHPQKALIEQKIALSAFDVDIRVATVAPESHQADVLLSQIISSFGVYHLAESNSLSGRSLKPDSQQKLKQAILARSHRYTPEYQHLNLLEIASLFHFPNANLVGIKNIAWGKMLKGEPPTQLPIDEGLTPEERKQINFFARTEYKNRMTLFGIRRGEDRRRHVYILGKSGTGKSTLIGNMAITDINNGEGVVVVDPHGDLSDIILNYIPDNRIKDVVYLNPADKEQSFRLNLLQVKNPEYRELIVSGILSIFTKIWANLWSARMEYILRNTLMTLVYKDDSTFIDIPKLLTNPRFRNDFLENVTDPAILAFWHDEYDKYSEKFQSEAIAPILNKVGQFITSPTVKNIIGHSESTIDIEDLINSGKIVILNVAQGKIGEDNSALLGAMFITQIQIAAMNRVNIPEDERRDVFVYVDEFQNFATTSFTKILSEARKFHLNLILANQYTAQLPEEIQKAIFGNAGTIMSFVVGADDATRLMNELGNTYTQNDLVSLVKHQIIVKMTVNGTMSTPFPAYTLAPPTELITTNRDQVLAASHGQYYKKIVKDEVKVLDPTTIGTSALENPPDATSFTGKPVPQSHIIPTLDQLDKFRVSGFKPTIITCVIYDKKVLLGYNAKYGFWQFPQGGVTNKETLEQALSREMTNNLGAELVKTVTTPPELIYEDRIEFPEDKHNMRDMRLDNGQPALMKGKKYFYLTFLPQTTTVRPVRTEFNDLRWVDYKGAEKLIVETTSGGKQRVTLGVLDILKAKGLLA